MEVMLINLPKSLEVEVEILIDGLLLDQSFALRIVPCQGLLRFHYFLAVSTTMQPKQLRMDGQRATAKNFTKKNLLTS
jgi:hypothetical protein